MRNVENGIMLVKSDRIEKWKSLKYQGSKNAFKVPENRRRPTHKAQNTLLIPQSDSARSSSSSGDGLG